MHPHTYIAQHVVGYVQLFECVQLRHIHRQLFDSVPVQRQPFEV